jgi:hypothetical protein
MISAAKIRDVVSGRVVQYLAAVILLILAPVGIGSQEVVIGGETDVRSGVQGDLLRWDGVTPFISATLSPILSVYGDALELRSQFTVETELSTRDLAASADELKLTFYPSDAIVVHVGLFTPKAGAALLLSPVNYLAGLDPGGLNGSSPTLDDPVGVIAMTFFSGDFYLEGSAAPVPARPSLLEGWSVPADLPFLETVTDTAIPGVPLTRAGVELVDPIRAPELARLSGQLEAGWAGMRSDLSLFAYHGLDRIPTVTGLIDTNVGGGEFLLQLRQEEAAITALGCSIQSVLGPVMLWGDGSFVFGRSFGTTSVDPVAVGAGVWSTEVATAPAIDLVAGGALQLYDLWTTLAVEYRHGFVMSDRSDLVRLDLPGTLLARIDIDLLEGALTVGTTGVALLPDRSGLLVLSAAYVPTSELTVGVQAPLVITGSDALLEPFRSYSSLAAFVTVRF